MRFDDRQERERYMDSLERQMEQKREEIGRTLDEMQGSGRQTVLRRLRSSLPSLPSRTSVRDTEGECSAAKERPDGEASRNWWQFWR
jgi:hypothetical protein